MSTLQNKVQDLHDKVFTGRLLDAFDEYYHDDVVMTESGQEPRVGKAANRTYEEQFVGGVKAFHDAGIRNMAVKEESDGTGVAFIETYMHLDHTHMGDDARLEQVSVQEWKDGQIVKETFYHA